MEYVVIGIIVCIILSFLILLYRDHTLETYGYDLLDISSIFRALVGVVFSSLIYVAFLPGPDGPTWIFLIPGAVGVYALILLFINQVKYSGNVLIALFNMICQILMSLMILAVVAAVMGFLWSFIKSVLGIK